MPRTHVKALTYAPKIPGVLSGKITQTIRPYLRNAPEKAVSSGDFILFHGWEGKPYRSPWSWRLKVQVDSVIYASAYPNGMYLSYAPGFKQRVYSFMPWDCSAADDLAHRDGIDPATGIELKRVLESLGGKITDAGVGLQIIRWSWPPVEG